MTGIPYWHFTVGILTDPNAVNDWNHLAEVWVVDNGIVEEGDTGTYTYCDSIVGGVIWTDKQAEVLADDFLRAMRNGYRINAAGHSNGGKLLCRALQLHPEIRLGELHLIASAADVDCDKNGLNQAARNGQFESVTIYISPEDEILSSPIAYGQQGLKHPQNVGIELLAKLRISNRKIEDAPCRHSDWVGKNFEATMRIMTGLPAQPAPEDVPTVTDSTTARASLGGSP